MNKEYAGYIFVDSANYESSISRLEITIKGTQRNFIGYLAKNIPQGCIAFFGIEVVTFPSNLKAAQEVLIKTKEHIAKRTYSLDKLEECIEYTN